MSRPSILALLMLSVASALLTGCHSVKAGDSRYSTRITVDDLNQMSAAMSQSLARSDALKDRGAAAAPPWVISIDKVANLSSDIMTESERWFVIQKIRSSMPIQAFAKQKNITFVIPAERVAEMKRNPKFGVKDEPGFGEQRRPTHQMTATFRSLTRGSATERTEQYYCEFELIDLSSPVTGTGNGGTGGTPVWIDKFEYKRGATGHLWD